MRQILWTDEAVGNLEAIVTYVSAFNPAAAARLSERPIAAADSLAEYSERGRDAGEGRREMTTENEGDFGTYLATVQERDIDLLLMEEFHVSPDFVDWFAGQAGYPGAQFAGAWHSVTDADGETDLLLRIRIGGERVGILIENKIGAGEQERQSERYHLRAARAQNEGKFDGFVTCICAPQCYLDGLPASSLYQVRIAYESVEGWFGNSHDARSVWRKRIMAEAGAHGRRGYRMIVNEAVSAFHASFWRFLQDQYPTLIMRRPTPKGSRSNWILFKGVGFPAHVGFHLKLDQRCVELGFRNRVIEDLVATEQKWPDDVILVQKGKTAALSISVPFIDRTRNLEEQVEALEHVIKAVARLWPYAHLLD